MMEFVICDDNEVVLKNIEKIIIKFMKNKQFKIKKFDDYDNKFINYISSAENRIYILDIETPSNSGIEMARLIRKNDKKSVIIFITGYEQYGYRLLKSRLNFLTFISKYDDYENNLMLTLEEAIKFNDSLDVLEFFDNGIKFKVRVDKILYISKSTYDRKSVIKTDCNEYKTNISLEKLLNMSDCFLQTHRSCIVNYKRVETFDYKNGIIIFDSGIKLNLLSDKFKKEIVKNG